MGMTIPEGFEVIKHKIFDKPTQQQTILKAVELAAKPLTITEVPPVANKFVTVMEKIAEDVKIAFEDVVKYLPEASKIAELLFPASVVPLTVATNVVDLVQKAVVLVEQKFAAAGINAQAGAAKAATVLSIVSPVVTQTLTEAGVTVNATLVQNVINGVVAILNLSQTTTA